MGVAIARRFGGEVVSVDSMQIYRGMAIGTAAPTAEEMGGIPHHMIAVADPAESWSVARYVTEADRCVQDILRRGKVPVLVGGTGLWLDALVRGTAFAAGSQGGRIRRALQQRLQEEGAEVLLDELRQIDPETAARLHPRDEKRIVRALEVWQETGETLTRHDRRTQELPPRYDAVYIGLDFADRADLRACIDARVDNMVARGLLNEVRALLSAGLPPDATALQAIGYKQFLPVAQGVCTEAEAVEEVKLRSRQYAKRQLTWLRRNSDIHWLYWGKDPDFPAAIQKATEILLAEGLS
jgi:tRNA dimethylallyltransferase